MNFTEYTSVKNKFISSPNLCDLFKLLSIETWKRIEYAYRQPGVKVFETTITQNIIFTINAFNDQYNLNIELYESLDERVNGNDMELIIKYPKDGIEYYTPIQAKKVYKNGKYKSMDHGNQIELFIRYAKKNKAKPLYLLYNYSDSMLNKNNIIHPKELIGCAFISAEHLFNNYYKKRISRKRDGSIIDAWLIPNFNDLYPSEAFAWHEIVCPDNPKVLYENLKTKKILMNQEINISEIVNLNNEFRNGFFKINTISNSGSWINIKEFQDLFSKRDIHREDVLKKDEPTENKEKNESLILYSEQENNFPEFSPKSRIVITKNEQ